MPEGHTIHRVARDHGKLFNGTVVSASSPQGRFADGARQIDRSRLERVEAHGKHLFYHWAPPARSNPTAILHVHLGLYGKFRLHRHKAETPYPSPRGAVRLRVEAAPAAFDLNGPNTCELINESAYEACRARLGPDPLRPDAEPEVVWRRIQRSRSPIGTLLMNQSVIAGVGNIYRCEVLHLLGIHPEREGREVARNEFDQLWRTLTELMTEGVRLNRIVIADPERLGKPRGRMTKDERLRIYKKPLCPDCGGAVDEWTLAGRTVFACPQCQD